LISDRLGSIDFSYCRVSLIENSPSEYQGVRISDWKGISTISIIIAGPADDPLSIFSVPDALRLFVSPSFVPLTTELIANQPEGYKALVQKLLISWVAHC